MRISQENENSLRKGDHQSQTPQQTQKADNGVRDCFKTLKSSSSESFCDVSRSSSAPMAPLAYAAKELRETSSKSLHESDNLMVSKQSLSFSFSFPKSARLLSKGHYQRVSRSGSKFFGEWLVIDYVLSHASSPKLGITVSKRFGKAHDRNRFKRIVREAFRLKRPYLPKNLELIVFPRKSTPPSLLSTIKDLEMLIEKLHVTQSRSTKSGSCH